MYKVVIFKLQFDGYKNCEYEGTGSTSEVALKRAEKEMLKDYPDGVFGINYSVYKESKNTNNWNYQGTFGR